MPDQKTTNDGAVTKAPPSSQPLRGSTRPPPLEREPTIIDDPDRPRISPVAAGFAGLVLAAVALVAGVLLTFFIPSFWLSMGIAYLLLLLVTWRIDRQIQRSLALMIGPIVLAAFLGFVTTSGPGNEAPGVKPAPWVGQAWQGTAVEYWELETGSRIGFVRFEPDNPIDAAPVLFLHGGPGGGVVPQDGAFARQLADEGFEVYLYDQAGVGWSDLVELEDYTIERMVADLDAIRQTIGVEHVNLVGHSWGGSLATHYLVSHDDRVERAWLSNPGDYGGVFEHRDRAEEPDLTAADGNALLLDQMPPIRFVLGLGLGLAGAKIGAVDDLVSQEQMVRYLPDYIDEVPTFQDTRCAGDPYTADELEWVAQSGFNMYVNLQLNAAVVDHDPVEGLNTIQTPVIVARGVCDHLPWDSHRHYRDNLPNAQLVVIPDEGHDMRPAREIVSFFTTGDSGLRPYLSDAVPTR